MSRVSDKDSSASVANLFVFSAVVWSNFLAANSYSIFCLEGILLILSTASALALPLVLMRKVGRAWISDVLLVILFIDLNFGIPKFNKAQYILFLVFAVVLLSMLVSAFAIKDKIPKLVLVWLSLLLATVLVPALLSPMPLLQVQVDQRHGSKVREKPNIIIIVVDAYIGLEGLPDSVDGEVVRSRLRSLYKRRGFEFYDRAHSNYFSTKYSLPTILNFSLKPEPKSFKLLRQLRSQGYAINVYQSNLLRYTDDPELEVLKSASYHPNSIGHLRGVDVPIRERISLIAISFVDAHKSHLLNGIRRVTRKPPVNPCALSTTSVLEAVKRDLLPHKRGTVFFVHVIDPHYPFIFKSDGGIKSIFQWESSGKGERSSEARERRYQAYYEQIDCLEAKIEELLRVIPFYEETTIVLFGDHGSRINRPRVMDWSKWTSQNIVDCYSSLLVVKNGAFHAGSVPSTAKVSTAQVIGHFFHLTKGRASDEFDNIYLYPSSDGRSMPDF